MAFDAIDQDGSGQVNREEWIKFWENKRILWNDDSLVVKMLENVANCGRFGVE